MKTIPIVALLVVMSSQFTFAQTTAFTSDGRTVLLKEDGTWSYTTSIAQPAETDFRKTTWGMSAARVKSLESIAPALVQNGSLTYKGSISSLETDIVYSFTNDSLTRARYVLTNKHSNENDYIADFSTLKTQLTKKYGTPLDDKAIWTDNSNVLKNHPDRWGFAIRQGQLAYSVKWATPRTQISLTLIAADYQINLIIEYASTDLGKLEEAQDLRDF
jgi:hypothetical protein